MTGERGMALQGHPNGVGATRVAFSPRGKWLVSSSTDGTTRVYAVDVDDLVALAHSCLTRWLTAEECQQYLHQDECPQQP